jgi:hypothetical protein
MEQVAHLESKNRRREISAYFYNSGALLAILSFARAMQSLDKIDRERSTLLRRSRSTAILQPLGFPRNPL